MTTPMAIAVAAVANTSATRRPATATTPRPIRMLMASEPVPSASEPQLVGFGLGELAFLYELGEIENVLSWNHPPARS